MRLASSANVSIRSPFEFREFAETSCQECRFRGSLKLLLRYSHSFGLLVAFTLLAADVGAQKRSFEVASIRSTTVSVPSSLTVSGERVTIRNYQLRSLLLLALGPEAYQVAAPEWVREFRFDIQALMPSGSTRDHVPEMVHALLVDRFGLITHIEQRSLSAYDLIVNGNQPRMLPVQAVDELAKQFRSESVVRVFQSVDNDVRRMTEIHQSTVTHRTVTPTMLYEKRWTERSTHRLIATRMSMGELSKVLTQHARRPVIDRTGLEGLFQFEVELPRIDYGMTFGLVEPSPVSVQSAARSLGLQLEPRRAPINVVVVDKIAQRPTEN